MIVVPTRKNQHSILMTARHAISTLTVLAALLFTTSSTFSQSTETLWNPTTWVPCTEIVAPWGTKAEVLLDSIARRGAIGAERIGDPLTATFAIRVKDPIQSTPIEFVFDVRNRLMAAATIVVCSDSRAAHVTLRQLQQTLLTSGATIDLDEEGTSSYTLYCADGKFAVTIGIRNDEPTQVFYAVDRM